MATDAQVLYRVPRSQRGWELHEETMPESVAHDEAVELLKAILAWWGKGREGVRVARNLAVRWDEDEPRIGVDPDVCVLSPAPQEPDLRSVRTWRPGHAPPMLAIEVVSETNPHKDYAIAPDKYAASGTRELWIFDPLLAGPRSHGGPFRLQVWERDEQGRLSRSYAGEGPAYSPVLRAYLVPSQGGQKLRLASDREGALLWLTAEEAEREGRRAERAAREQERVAKERERLAKEEALAAKEQERDAKEQALARVAALEAALAKA